MSARTASICSAEGGVGSSRSSRGRRTCTRSRAGFSLTPAKSSTCASTLTLLRIVSRLRPAAWRAATSAATSAGEISSTRREPRSGRRRSSWTRCPTAVASATSTREARQLAAASASVGDGGETVLEGSDSRYAHGGELAGDPAPSRQCFPPGREGAGVAVGALAPAEPVLDEIAAAAVFAPAALDPDARHARASRGRHGRCAHRPVRGSARRG